MNNPVCYSDPAGESAKIWYILFEEHDPGFIHRQVQAHIVADSIFKSEFVLPGIGRADIYNPQTGEIWEIKHGGSSTEMMAARTNEATQQVSRYIAFEKITLKSGHAYTFAGSFVINCDSISYLIEYHTPAEGVILYHVQQLKKYNNSPYKVKYRTNVALAPASDNKYAYAAAFMCFALGCAAAVVISLQPNIS